MCEGIGGLQLTFQSTEGVRHTDTEEEQREREKSSVGSCSYSIDNLGHAHTLSLLFFPTGLSFSVSLSLILIHTHTHTHTHTQGSWGPVKWAAELLGILSESSSERDCGAQERKDAGERWDERRRQKHSNQKRACLASFHLN